MHEVNSEEIQKTVQATHESLERLSVKVDKLYIDGNTVDAAIRKVVELDSIEEAIDSVTNKKEYYNLYKAASAITKPVTDLAESIRKLLRGKLLSFISSGGVHKSLSKKKAGFSAIIDDESKIPRKYLTVDIKKIEQDIADVDGNIEIPGVSFKKKFTLVIKVKE